MLSYQAIQPMKSTFRHKMTRRDFSYVTQNSKIGCTLMTLQAVEQKQEQKLISGKVVK